MQIIQFGESPNPIKHSKQSVHSLEAEATRLGLSVGSGVREPQCESVKRYSPVSYIERKPIPSPRSQAAIRHSKKREYRRFRRGSRAWRAYKVVSAYLGDLTGSER